MRRQREVNEAVRGRAGRYHEVAENLRGKEVSIEGRRYIVCHNPQEAAGDAAEREAIVKSLGGPAEGRGRATWGGNCGYRRFLRTQRGAITIDRMKVEADVRHDGKSVLRTNTSLSAEEVAVQHKRLLMVEQFFWGGQVAAAHPADSPPVGCDDPGTRVRFLPGAGAGG